MSTGAGRAWVVTGLCALLSLALACQQPDLKPIAGVHSAAAPVLFVGKGEPRSFSVGSQLLPGDRLEASGPAVLEFYGGAIRFLEKGDELVVGKAEEAQLVGSNLEDFAVLTDQAEVEELPRQRRIVAARYVSAQFTPKVVSGELGTGDYLAAFFTPNGIANLGKSGGGAPEGPRRALPPPPHRNAVPHLHAGELGQGGMVAQIEDGFAAAETPQLTTAILLEDNSYELGTTTRLLLSEDAEVTLNLPDGRQVELEGPGDFRLR